MSKNQKHVPRIGITLGDINGIGPEVIIKALSDNRIMNNMTPVIYGSTKTLSYYRKNYHQDEFNYMQVKQKGETIVQKVNVVNCWNEVLEIKAGEVTEQGAIASRLALQKAVIDLKEGHIDALVTGPINKHNIQSDDFNFPGHTEYLTDAFNSPDSLMLLVSDDLRIGVVTSHIALKDVANKITSKKIVNKLRIMVKSLTLDFGLQKPKIAVLGLNPHNGDNGLMGNEEAEIISPAIEILREEGTLVFGPFPADGFFGGNMQKGYDGVLAMYHDQGLVPFKTLAFDTGVNYTAGLPIIRTSPDHGTAYSIAGKNEASETSMRQAIFLAYDIWRNRRKALIGIDDNT
ncbi:MAG: 4-hydroxythreonine-4-phosphate dehydrogenase PdxA [Cyclobacteriaceae bacterium]|nr:4-hydroxythreonine-4-phosphate dehydrogenase PdxA [Cyclobacteriaceae bacterium]